MAELPPVEYCVLWIDHWSTCITKAEWSGWVQAVGAIAAIIAAASIAGWSERQRVRESRHAASHRLMMKAYLCEHVYIRATDMANCIFRTDESSQAFIRDPATWNELFPDIDRCAKAINELTIQDMGSVDELMKVQSAQRHINAMAGRYGSAVSGTTIAYEERERLLAHAAQLHGLSEVLQRLAVQHRRGRFISVADKSNPDNSPRHNEDG